MDKITDLKFPFTDGQERGPAVIAFAVIFIGMTAIFAIFEFVFFVLLFKMQHAGKYEIWFFQVLIITIYLIIIFVTSHSRIARFMYFITCIIIAAFVLGLLIWIRAFTTLKLLMTFMIAMNMMGLVITYKTKGIVLNSVKKRSIFIIALLSSSVVISAGFMSFSPMYVEIDPDSNPELIFWCGSSQLPNDTETLDICSKYNIGFAATIRNHTVGDEECMSVYKNIIKHGVNLHFAIGADAFFCHIGNAHEFSQIYDNIRNWFASEGILNSSYIKSFCVDAETPQYYVEELEQKGPVDALNYMADNYPTEDEVDQAEKGLQDFTESVRSDNKEAGIVRCARMLDEVDGDDDMNLLTRNVYGLGVDWDYSVTMLYRTNRGHAYYNEGEEGDTVDFSGDWANFFLGTVVEGVKFTVSDYAFYQNVATEQTPGEVNCDVNDQFIFVGNFKYEYKDTSYIKDKEFYKDIDICRHFEEEKIFLYELGGFLRHYGWDEVEALGKYCQQDEKWMLKYNADDAIMIVLLYGIYVFYDMIAFFEEDTY